MFSQQIELYGGVTVQMRPATVADVDALEAMHNRLSTQTLRFRYHGPRKPTAKQLQTFCSTESNNAAYVITPVDEPDTIIGIGHYVIVDEHSAVSTETVNGVDSAAAELAFLIEDRFQGYGLGKRLFTQLREHAVVAGIKQFLAYVDPANFSMMRVFYGSGLPLDEQFVYGTREVKMALG